MTTNKVLSPVRSGMSEDIFKDGLIDFQQINYILRNPELPKSKLTINLILKQYNEEKCRAITLERINYRLRHQNVNNSNATNSRANNSSDSNAINAFNSNNSNNNNMRIGSNSDGIDLDALGEYEVKLSQLPTELIVNILGETFEKYQMEMNRRHNNNIDTNVTFNRNESVVDMNNVVVKRELITDMEIDSQLKTLDLEVNELKLHLKKLIGDYEAIEKEEMSVLNNLEIVTKELENKLSQLRECIALCELLKEQNLVLSDKQNALKTKKSQLKHEINELNNNLIQLNNRIQINETNQRMNSSSNVEPIAMSSSTCDSSNDRQQVTNTCNSPLSPKMVNLQENSLRKRKVIPNIISGNSRKDKQSVEKNKICIKKSQNNNTISDSAEDTSNKHRKMTITTNTITKAPILPLNTDLNGVEILAEDFIPLVDDDFHLKDKPQNNEMQTNDTLSKDWRSNYVNFAFTPALPINFSSSSFTSSSSTTCVSNPLVEIPIQTSNATQNRTSNAAQNQTHRLPSASNSANRYTFRREGFRPNNPNLIDVTHNIKNVFDSLKHVTCLFTSENILFVGLKCGLINKYLIEKNSFKFLHQFPKLKSAIKALYYSQKYNYLYCGTDYGLFTYLNSNSNESNYDKIFLYQPITCFESSTTILYIGSANGLIHRFGLMSNKMINNFKCLNQSIIGLKLVNDLTEQNRIIVCGKSEISVRNSVDGSLLQTLENNANNLEFVSSELYSNQIVVFFNFMDRDLHCFYIYDECVRNVTNELSFRSHILLMAMSEHCYYAYTSNKELYCFDFEKLSIQWMINIKSKRPPLSMAVNNKNIILGMLYGKIQSIIPDNNCPIVCKCYNCNAKFPRMSDICEHFHWIHAMPFSNNNNNINSFYNCSWIGCNMRLRCSTNPIAIIVEHLKSHIN